MSSSSAPVFTKAEIVLASRSIDWLVLVLSFLVFTGGFHIHAMLTMGDWDFWTDWKDRRLWPTVTPIMTITFPAAVQYWMWDKMRLPFGATFTILGLLFGEWVNRYFNFWGWTYFPINFVWPATLVPGAILLDVVLLWSKSFLITAVVGGLSFGLIFYPGNWAMLAVFHQPVEYHGMSMTIADIQGYHYIRTGTPEYIRFVEKGTLRTFGNDVVPVSAFFSGFMSSLIYYIWHFFGRWYCTTRFLEEEGIVWACSSDGGGVWRDPESILALAERATLRYKFAQWYLIRKNVWSAVTSERNGETAILAVAERATLRYKLPQIWYLIRKNAGSAVTPEKTSASAPKDDVVDLSDPLPDDVTCSVFSPHLAAPGDAILIQAYAHLPGQEEEVAAMAKKADLAASLRGSQPLPGPVPRGAKLGFHLQIKGVDDIDPADIELVWQGKPLVAQFGVFFPEDFQPRDVIATVQVTKDRVPIGHIKFTLQVVTRAVAEKQRADAARLGTLFRYKEAFASYASQDRPVVLLMVQAISRTGIKVFFDIQLDPGDRWAQKLYKHIDTCDVFYLFWSKAAKASEWVLKETLYARKRQGGKDDTPPAIIPMIIEGPPPVEAPPELNFLQFNDYLLYARAGAKAEAEARRKNV